ncbi:tubulin-tyrosine ligase family protein, putative [Ichthyophthirius multifiliis]|uniref:Tubulin-tyrosine ligase family protein, putative n=1 Tax=Ichthyophthirius multifiliis TaxID=5932 RepID=G0R4Y9_ICHMU|nr:tubulin-tyrosine ligase family protein, putative [Ichthyophthirius multifiliis]EGR27473.1 tubulin-tyrosine ligase family protein, putative [Ichthyophthirius multifiliis]|eukprot:XP_004024383.1 tubulin-tyrosine ligase family protein, putative [Ichthyophthirius multifiliis]
MLPIFFQKNNKIHITYFFKKNQSKKRGCYQCFLPLFFQLSFLKKYRKNKKAQRIGNIFLLYFCFINEKIKQKYLYNLLVLLYILFIYQSIYIFFFNNLFNFNKFYIFILKKENDFSAQNLRKLQYFINSWFIFTNLKIAKFTNSQKQQKKIFKKINIDKYIDIIFKLPPDFYNYKNSNDNQLGTQKRISKQQAILLKNTEQPKLKKTKDDSISQENQNKYFLKKLEKHNIISKSKHKKSSFSNENNLTLLTSPKQILEKKKGKNYIFFHFFFKQKKDIFQLPKVNILKSFIEPQQKSTQKSQIKKEIKIQQQIYQSPQENQDNTYKVKNKKQKNIKKKIQYYVGEGNNNERIRKLLQKRSWWSECTDKTSFFINFKWQQSSIGYKFDKLTDQNQFKQVVNHFEFHKEITNKQNLIKNLIQFCESNKLNPFETITPLTYVIDFKDDNCEMFLNSFLKFYENNVPQNLKNKINTQYSENIKKLIKQQQITYGIYGSEKYVNHVYVKQTMHESFLDKYNSSYIWILKPTYLNRGRGINMFNSLQQLEKIISNYLEGFEEQPLRKKNERKIQVQKNQEEQKYQIEENLLNTQRSKNQIQQKNTQSILLKSNQFIIQKYIEKPLLLNNRKFDIRVWALLTHELEILFFREGYIRLSSSEFSLRENQIDNQFIHLTNNAIQKFSDNYGQYENGNMWTMNQLWSYLYQINNNFTEQYYKDKILSKIKIIIWITFCSVRKKINMHNRKHCFEIFGYDFLIDSELNIWLLEVNTNPAIDECSNILKKLVPRMIDDALQLTVDKIFQKKNNKNIYKDDQEQKEEEKYSVDGYEDDFNMWQCLKRLHIFYQYIKIGNLQEIQKI